MTNLQELKALAYDQIVTIERSQSNLKHLTARISELEMQSQMAEDPKTLQAKSEAEQAPKQIEVKEEHESGK